MGIEESLKTISDVKGLAVDSISLFKDGGFSFLKIGAILRVMSEVNALVVDGKGSLPELKDLEPAEVGQLTTAAFAAMKAIISSLA